MTDRKRDPLPEGYRFGDAGEGKRVILLEADEFIAGVLPKNVTVQVKPSLIFHRMGFTMTYPPKPTDGWNVIEGEHFASDAERHPVVEGFTVDRDHGDEA